MHKIYLTLLSLLMLCSCESKPEKKRYTPPTQVGEYIYLENFKNKPDIYHSDRKCPKITNGVQYIKAYSYQEDNYRTFCTKCFNDELYYDLRYSR